MLNLYKITVVDNRIHVPIMSQAGNGEGFKGAVDSNASSSVSSRSVMLGLRRGLETRAE